MGEEAKQVPEQSMNKGELGEFTKKIEFLSNIPKDYKRICREGILKYETNSKQCDQKSMDFQKKRL